MEINHRPGPLLLSSWRRSLTWWYTVLTTSRLNGTHVSLVNHFRVTHESSCEYACANVISQREIALPTLLVLACVNWQRFPFDVTSSEVFEMCTPFSSKWALMSKPFLDRIITLHWLSVAILVIVPREHSLRMAILRRKTSEPTTINWLSNYSHEAEHVLQVNYPDPVLHLSTRTGLRTRPCSCEFAH